MVSLSQAARVAKGFARFRRAAKPRIRPEATSVNVGGSLLSAPWVRAPLLLFRRPGVFVAVLGAALVLGAVAASGPLFLSSAANASLHAQIDHACGSKVGPSYATGVLFRSAPTNRYQRKSLPALGRQLLDLREAQIQDASGDLPRLRQVLTLDLRAQVAGGSGVSGNTVRVLSRSGFFDHIDIMQEAAGDGVFISDRGARDLGVTVGGSIRLIGVNGELSPVRVKGIYRDLREGAAYEDDYWCELRDDFYQNPFGGAAPVYDVLLADRSTVLTIADSLGQALGVQFTSFIDSHGMTTDQAADVIAGIDRQRSALFGAGDPPGQPFYELLSHDELAQFLPRAQLAESALTSTVIPIATAGCLVAFLVVGASAVYWVDRRRMEVDVLAAHGVGPAAVGFKAALEMMPATVLGSGLGWGVALGLVKIVGPSSLLSAGRPIQGLELAAEGMGGAVLILGLLSGLRVHASTERPVGTERRWPALVPWELLLLGGAGGIIGLVVHGRDVTSSLQHGSVAHIDPLLLVFPLLFFVGAITLINRLLGAVLPRLRGLGGGWPNVPYLALRRMTGMPLVTVLFVATAAMPAAVALYGATVSASVRTTLETEAHLQIGADVAMLLGKATSIPASLRGHATEVSRYPQQRLGEQSVDVLGIDPSTFLSAAYTDPTAEGPAPKTVMRLITVSQPEKGPVPAILVGGERRGTQQLVISQLSSPDVQIRVRVVGSISSFPSQGRSGSPLLLLDERSLASVQSMQHELWVMGDEQRVLRQAAAADLPVTYALLASAVIDRGVFLPVTYTFDYLTALAVLAAVAGFGGMFLYLESRSRARRLSYVMARRMGLSRFAHFGSLTLELLVALSAGLLLGLGLALAAAHAVADSFDIDTGSPPSTILVTPYTALGVVALITASTIVAASLLAQRSLDRARPAEVLRGA